MSDDLYEQLLSEAGNKAILKEMRGIRKELESISLSLERLVGKTGVVSIKIDGSVLTQERK